MQKPVIFIAGLLLVLAACDKNKFNTKPSLTIKSISPTTVPVGGTLNCDFEYTDKEGDISDSIFVKRIRLNVVPQTETTSEFGFSVPSFTSKPKGDITVILNYLNHLPAAQNPPPQGNPPVNEPDTCIFKFALRDKAGHISDTVTTQPIFILR